MNLRCTKCEKQLPDDFYSLTFGSITAYQPERGGAFCSRLCVVEFIAPEIKQAVVVSQWVPTPEEEARMSQ